MFGYENGLFYPVHVSDEKFKDSMDSLFLTGGNKSHYVYIKNFNRFMRHKTKHKIIKHFCRYCLQFFSSERVLIEHNKIGLKVNGKQSVKLRNVSTKFNNYPNPLAAPFKIHADFESVLKGVRRDYRGNNTSYTEKHQKHIPCSFTYIH